VKTNQKILVKFEKGELPIFHKSQMGDLNILFAMGNMYRVEEGLQPLSLNGWIKRQDVQDYIKYLKNNGVEEPIKRTRGKGATTLAHLKVLLDAAIALSPKLKDEVYETFINNKMLFYRDNSGDNYLNMIDALTLYAEGILGKQAHKGHYITIANIIKKRLGVNDWNTATAEQLRERDRIEQTIVSMLKTGVVRDWEHLKELVDKI